MPYLSIVLPTYNRARTILKAVNSVVRQTYKNWELIIIDDGSNDTTKSVLKKYLYTEQIRYFWQKNKGVVGAELAGIKKAKGKIITFLDSDDTYKKSHLTKHMSYLKKNPQIDIIYSYTTIIGNKYVPDIFKKGKKIHIDKTVCEGTLFFKKYILQSVKLNPTEKIGEGNKFIQNAKNYGFKIKRLPYKTYIYNRTQKNSITKSFEKSF